MATAGIDFFHLTQEIEASEMGALEAVMSVDEERAAVEREVDQLSNMIAEEVSRAEEGPWHGMAWHR